MLAARTWRCCCRSRAWCGRCSTPRSPPLSPACPPRSATRKPCADSWDGSSPSPTRAPTGRAARCRPRRSSTRSMTYATCCRWPRDCRSSSLASGASTGSPKSLPRSRTRARSRVSPTTRGCASRGCATWTRRARGWRAPWPRGANAVRWNTTARAAGSSMTPCCARSWCRCRARCKRWRRLRQCRRGSSSGAARSCSPRCAPPRFRTPRPRLWPGRVPIR